MSRTYKAYAGGPDPVESNAIVEYYACNRAGCDRYMCTASEPGFAEYCCRMCAENPGLHSAKCDLFFERMKARLVPSAPQPREPLRVNCRYCLQTIELNQDSPQARAEGTDPFQQMRRHLLDNHAVKLLSHARKMGWLIDMMGFQAASVEQEREWKARVHLVVDSYIDGSAFDE